MPSPLLGERDPECIPESNTTTDKRRESVDGDPQTTEGQLTGEFHTRGGEDAAFAPPDDDIKKYQKKIIYLERRNKLYELHLKKLRKQMAALMSFVQSKQDVNVIASDLFSKQMKNAGGLSIC